MMHSAAPLAVVPAWQEQDAPRFEPPGWLGSSDGTDHSGRHMSGKKMDDDLIELETQLVETLRGLCRDAVEKFEAELHGRLKSLHAVHRGEGRTMTTVTTASKAPKRHSEHTSSKSSVQKTGHLSKVTTFFASDDSANAMVCGDLDAKAPDHLLKARVPLQLPRTELQKAALLSQMMQGKSAADEVAVGAGFLGGGGPFMQTLWMILGIVMICLSFVASHPPIPEETDGEMLCSVTCERLRWLRRATLAPAGLLFCGRGYFLSCRRYRHAYLALLLAGCVVAPCHAFGNVVNMYIVFDSGCVWPSEASIYSDIGPACRWLGLLDTGFRLVLSALIAAMVWALWLMRKAQAETCLFVGLTVQLSSSVLRMGTLLWIGGSASKAQLATQLVTGTICVCLLSGAVFRKNRSRRRAWELVREDAAEYDAQWHDIVSDDGDAVARLAETALAIDRDIKKSTQEGPRSNLRTEENLRRTLLQSSQRAGGGVQQELSSLPLLYAQAFELDSHFQLKCAEWAAGCGLHMASGIKQAERAIEKVWRTYDGNCQKLLDLVRCSIVCDHLDVALTVVNRIREDPAACLLRIKNRFDPHYDSADSGGYRNLSLNIMLVDLHTRRAWVDRHICEVQIVLSSMHERKSERGHRRYVQFRDRRAE
eukprot:TRINITY_DN112836_c0_g1_i1.p1 TRINITY_DN112836_c0_g1~~TRINITY_DN112836_c0_g1_i1.p1  ORF type:complete len:650 (+),score=65.75 TRINITY_DN112836_c0_g1_i1:131-2080(+)